MEPCFLEFDYPSQARFDDLEKVFYALSEAKRKNEIDPDDSDWLDYFDEEALMYFWWPTEQEMAEWCKEWKNTPVSERSNNPKLDERWDFGSMLDAIRTGEYELTTCKRINQKIGRLEYRTWSWPYGGAGALKELLACFGCKVVDECV